MGRTKGQFLSGKKAGFNSELSFSKIGWDIKAKEPNLL